MRVCPRCATETDADVCPSDGSPTVAVNDEQKTYEIGTLIAGRYRVDAVIGIGGFGAVYRCTQLNMQQTVAVKVLRPEHLASVEHVKRFSREAQAVSRLKHPNTIHTFDFGTHTDGALYLAMEFLEGATLADRLDQTRSIYWETAVQIAVQICHSLTEAHAQGLVHRDLKPENIMLMPVAGDPNFVKVLDFGIAKAQKDPKSPNQSNLTESGMIMGTPTYMSPEQAKGDPIDGRSDIYALGVMLYEMLTGKPPFDDETAMKILVAHINQTPAAFHRAGTVDDVPVDVERVVLQCLEKDPARRPQTTVQLVDRLVTALRRGREPSGVRPVDLGETARTPAPPVEPQGRPPTPVAGEVPHMASPAREPAPLPKPSRTPIWIAAGALAAAGLGVGVALSVGNPPVPAKPASVAAPAIAKPDAEPLAPLKVVPAVAKPAAAEPAHGGQDKGEPAKVAASKDDASKTEAAKNEAAKAEAAKLEAAKAEAAKADLAPAKTDAGKLDPKADKNAVKSNGRTGGKPESGKAETAKPDGGKAVGGEKGGEKTGVVPAGPTSGQTPPKGDHGKTDGDGKPKDGKDGKGGKDDFRLDDEGK